MSECGHVDRESRKQRLDEEEKKQHELEQEIGRRAKEPQKDLPSQSNRELIREGDLSVEPNGRSMQFHWP